MAKKFKYVNKSNQKQVIIGVGEALPDETIETEVEINNPNFRMVGIDPVTKPVSNKKRDK